MSHCRFAEEIGGPRTESHAPPSLRQGEMHFSSKHVFASPFYGNNKGDRVFLNM
jgi:hypothetical protein